MAELTQLQLALVAGLPAFFVLISVGMILYLQMLKEKGNTQQQIAISRDKKFLPLVCTAYERAILFLERIRPQNMLPHAESLQDSARALQLEMISNIREEYEHNLSQQLYISKEAWESLVQAKEQILTFINLSANELDENASGMELGKVILEKVSSSEELFVHKAIIVLKRDFNNWMPFS